MFKKFQGYVGKFTGIAKIQINQNAKAIKWIIKGYVLLVALLVLTYYAAWCWQWYTDTAVLSDLLAIIQEMVGASIFVSFICGCFVDLNGNGVPDNLEGDLEEKEEEI